MKILFTVPWLCTGGAEVLLRDLALSFRRAGHEVVIITLLSKEDEFIVRGLRESGVKIIHSQANIGKMYSVIGVIKNIVFLYKHLKNNRYDVVHTNLTLDIYCLAVVNLLLRRQLNLVTTEHNTVELRRNNFFVKWLLLEKIVYNNYLKIVCITSDVRDSVVQCLPETLNKCCVIKNGIDLERFKCVYIAADRIIEPIILCVGSLLVSRKGQDTLIKSMRFIKKGTLLLVGEGPSREYLEKLVLQYGLQERVFFLGRCDNVSELVKSASIYVQPSLYEGFGLAMLEAMAAGVPVVASDATGMRELISGVGVFFPIGNDIFLAKVVNELLDMPDELQKMSVKSLEKARNYSINKTADEYLVLYADVIKGK